MHQNKPVAPITYLNDKGQNILVHEEQDNEWSTPLVVNLKEIAILQTGLNRAYFNCNCDLNKDVLKSILAKVKECLKTIGNET
jgi:hypothetical protein